MSEEGVVGQNVLSFVTFSAEMLGLSMSERSKNHVEVCTVYMRINMEGLTENRSSKTQILF